MIDRSYSEGAATQTAVTCFFDSRLEAQAAAERLRSLGMGLQVEITEGAGDASTGSVGSDDDRGFFERLSDFFFPEDDRYTYAEGLSRGGCLLVATGVGPESVELVMDEMESAGAINIDERAESWRAEGWTSAAPLGGEAGSWSGMTDNSERGSASGRVSGSYEEGALSSRRSATGSGDEGTVPIVEERLRVGKRDISHGRVRVRSYVVEEPVTETVQLESERVEVERRPVDRPVTGAEGDLFRERTIEAEEYREEAVVSKEARVVEEVGLRRDHDVREETISDTVRRTEVEVESDNDRTGAGVRRSKTDRTGMTEYEAETGLPDDDVDSTGLTDRNRKV